MGKRKLKTKKAQQKRGPQQDLLGKAKATENLGSDFLFGSDPEKTVWKWITYPSEVTSMMSFQREASDILNNAEDDDMEMDYLAMDYLEVDDRSWDINHLVEGSQEDEFRDDVGYGGGLTNNNHTMILNSDSSSIVSGLTTVSMTGDVSICHNSPKAQNYDGEEQDWEFLSSSVTVVSFTSSSTTYVILPPRRRSYREIVLHTKCRGGAAEEAVAKCTCAQLLSLGGDDVRRQARPPPETTQRVLPALSKQNQANHITRHKTCKGQRYYCEPRMFAPKSAYMRKLSKVLSGHHNGIQ
ncbi:hypothetical protein ACA910_016121 [Epithemia clementina (nom. ined.)]